MHYLFSCRHCHVGKKCPMFLAPFCSKKCRTEAGATPVISNVSTSPPELPPPPPNQADKSLITYREGDKRRKTRKKSQKSTSSAMDILNSIGTKKGKR